MLLRDYQKRAVEAIDCSASRQTVVMACGTGKTLVALEAVKRCEAERVVLFFPTLGLLEQTFRFWEAHAGFEFEALAVCGQRVAGSEDISLKDVSIKHTTDSGVVCEFETYRGGVIPCYTPRVVFATYQSAGVIAGSEVAWDVMICDEAHRVAGSTDKAFTQVLEDACIPAGRRWFFTATPKISEGEDSSESVVVSMDNPAVFGPQVFTYSTREAIDEGFLSPYKVAVIGVTKSEVQEYSKAARGITSKDGILYKTVDNPSSMSFSAPDVAGVIALDKATKEYYVSNSLAFFNTIAASKRFSQTMNSFNPMLTVGCEHVDGTSRLPKRRTALENIAGNDEGLKVVSNAQCFTEGIDIPALDSVFFAEPRSSVIQIIQAVGRALRKNPKHNRPSLIILGLLVDDTAEDISDMIDRSEFRAVHQVLTALGDHDPSVRSQLRSLGDRSTRSSPNVVDFLLPEGVFSPEQLERFYLRVFDPSGSDWLERYQEIKNYLTKYGSFPTTQRDKSWMEKRRTAYRRNLLSQQRIELLEALPGWSWDPLEDSYRQHLAAVRGYVAEHGCLPVQGTVFRGLKLGLWVGSRRDEYRKGKLSPERIRDLESVSGWSWEPTEDSYRQHLAALRDYVAEYGCLPADRTVFRGLKLGMWVQRQRSDYRKGMLSSERVRELESVPGWCWDPFEDSFQQHLTAVKEYVAEYGVIPANKTQFCGLKLGVWAQNRRSDYRKGVLSSERIRELEAIPGWVWDSYEESYQQHLTVLREYVAEHGCLPVQGTVFRGVNLGSWVRSRRDDYRQGKLSEARVRDLESVPGWSWDPIEDSYLQHLTVLREYVAEFGSVPAAKTEFRGLILGKWVGSRRMEYRKGTLSSERVRELESVPGWSWDPIEDSYLQHLSALRVYVSEYGSMPAVTTVFGGLKLGQWVRTRRHEYRQGKLSPERIQELEGVHGWFWDPKGDSFQQYLVVLRDFVAETGVFPAQRTVFRGLNLGSWVRSRRDEYRQGKLSPERIRDLESVPGWVWDPIEDSYQQHLTVLREYVAEYGILPAEKTQFCGLNLGAWVCKRRIDYRRGKLSPERIQDLESIPGWWWGKG